MEVTGNSDRKRFFQRLPCGTDIFSLLPPRLFIALIRQRNIAFCQTVELEPDRSLEKRNMYLKKEAIEGTIHCKPGAAELLVLEVYTILTNGRVSDVEGPEPDFTDEEYQNLLPSLARSTASKAIKNNLTGTEIKAVPDISTNQRKAENILRRHLEHKAAERILNPGRFKVKPKRSQPAPHNLVPPSQMDKCSDTCSPEGNTLKLWSSPTWSRASVSFKEIKVRQPAKHSLVNY
ncbi:spermatogenesis-associated protein 4 isoform X2 [Oreochromis niloticus]|uniref:spermatogenesis-associated protein 4 isoform X2 n=1 Tax=Oreochromis niloticus TaxID=8128 RepID=UPI00039402AE|nr:spermatogenesis-associated protein 4 isoform X2 [Oreochromis niloticus]CAI5652948.1 unnamed protein product [Mustela putorius furo]